MQRVTMNLGIGIGGLAGGFIASESFQALFIIDAFTFVGYAVVLWLFVPEPRHAVERAVRSGSYRDVFRHRVFMGLMAVNAAFIAAGIAQLEVLPAYAKNEVGVVETGDRPALLHQHARGRAPTAPRRKDRAGVTGGMTFSWRWSASPARRRGCSCR